MMMMDGGVLRTMVKDKGSSVTMMKDWDSPVTMMMKDGGSVRTRTLR